MQNTKASLALSLALVVPAVACGSVDDYRNPLGLAGTYGGFAELTIEGDVEVTQNGGVVSAAASNSTVRETTFDIVAGIDSDAVALGSLIGCALSLEIEGSELVLSGSTECVTDDSENEFTFQGGKSESSTKSSMTFTRFDVFDAGDGRIEIEADGTSDMDQRAADGSKTAGTLEFQLDFEGVMVAR